MTICPLVPPVKSFIQKGPYPVTQNANHAAYNW